MRTQACSYVWDGSPTRPDRVKDPVPRHRRCVVTSFSQRNFACVSVEGTCSLVQNREIPHQHKRFAMSCKHAAQLPRHPPVDALHSIDSQELISPLISLTPKLEMLKP